MEDKKYLTTEELKNLDNLNVSDIENCIKFGFKYDVTDKSSKSLDSNALHFIDEPRLIWTLKHDLQIYMRKEIVDTLISLIKFDLHRIDNATELCSSEFFIKTEDITDVLKVSPRTLSEHTKNLDRLGLIERKKASRSGVQLSINYKDLTEIVFISAQDLFKVVFPKRMEVENLITRSEGKLSNFISETVNSVRNKLRTTLQLKFSKDDVSAVLSKLYRCNSDYKERKLRKDAQYTVIGSRVYFYYNLRKSASKKDLQILRYLVITGILESIEFENGGSRYGLFEIPSEFSIVTETETTQTEPAKETPKKLDKTETLISKTIDNTLDELNIENIPDNYSKALIEYGNYLKQENKIKFTLPLNIRLLEESNLTTEKKIEIIKKTMARGHSTVEYTLDKEVGGNKVNLTSKQTTVKNKNQSSQDSYRTRMEIFKKECAEQIKGLDPSSEEYENLGAEFFKKKGWL